MKQFKKWLKQPERWFCKGDRECVSAEEAWRAVLEEILSQLKRPIYSADIMKWIEQELENK